jgi:hypothetical protein
MSGTRSRWPWTVRAPAAITVVSLGRIGRKASPQQTSSTARYTKGGADSSTRSYLLLESVVTTSNPLAVKAVTRPGVTAGGSV